MPNATVYIRTSDWEKWQSIEDKANWLHLAIDGTNVPVINRAIHERKIIQALIECTPAAELLRPTSIDNPTNPTIQATTRRPIITKKNKDMDFCKHGAVKGFCKKGCK